MAAPRFALWTATASIVLAGCQLTPDPLANPAYTLGAPGIPPRAMAAPAAPRAHAASPQLLDFEPDRPSSARRGGAVLSGRVLDGAARPQPHAQIIAVATGRTGHRLDGSTDANGRFRLNGLEPGSRYLVLATATGPSDPLIGRVAITPPNENVIIQVSRAYASPSRSTARPPAGRPSDPVGHEPPQARKRRPSDWVAENIPEMPWDMPAPPAAREPEPADEPIADAPRPRGGDKPAATRPAEAPPWPARSEATPPRAERVVPPPAAEPPEVTRKAVDPRQPLARPTQVAAAPKFEQPGTLADPPQIPPERPARRTTVAAPPVYTGPSCTFKGDSLVDFQLVNSELQPVSFAQLGGELVLVDFWGTWCAPCVRAVPHLLDLQRRYGSRGLQVVGIAYEHGPLPERAALAKSAGEQLGINYPVLLGEEMGRPCPVLEKFQVGVFPTLVLLDRSGRVLWRAEGPGPQQFERLENLLKTRLVAASK